jgi:hypothetical protein
MINFKFKTGDKVKLTKGDKSFREWFSEAEITKAWISKVDQNPRYSIESLLNGKKTGESISIVKESELKHIL